MADGVVMIPLPGQPLACEPAGRGQLGQFLAGPENALVEPAVRGLLEPRPGPYSPLVLCGPSGTGKSHLARGLAAAWRDRYGARRLVYSGGADFARELADAIEAQAVDEFRARYRAADLLVLEDVGQLAEKPAAQEELIHTLDAVSRRSGQVVVTAPLPPAEMSELVPALRSRLSEGLVVPLARPEQKTRLAILRYLAQQRGITLTDPVAQILADGLKTTVPELFGVLVSLEAPARMDGKPIDAEAARDYLAQRSNARQPDVKEIAAAVSRYFGISMAGLRGPSRRRPLVAARDVAMYLARCLTQESLYQIGRYFGGRDHTTVMHGCRKTESLMKLDPAIRQAVEQLQEKWSGVENLSKGR